VSVSVPVVRNIVPVSANVMMNKMGAEFK